MSTITFKAKVVSAEKNKADRFYMIGLADDQYNYSNYVILQKAFSFSKQDKEAGMDGHYFEVNGQENSAYKVCRKVILKKESIVFQLDQKITEGLETVVVDISEVTPNAHFIPYLREILGDILEEQ